MTLRKKTVLILTITILGLLLIVYTTLRTAVLDSFIELEEQNTHQNLTQALAVLSDELAGLNSTAGDWAPWDNTYEFIVDGNPEYVKSNLVETTYINLRLNLVLFINAEGEHVFGQAFDLDKNEMAPLPPGLLDHLARNPIILQHTDPKGSRTGIILLPEAPLLFSSRPIVSSDFQGPIRGTMIMGRYLNASEITNLINIIHLPLTIHRLDQPLSDDFQEVRAELSKQVPIVICPLNDTMIAGYGLVEDVYGNPALMASLILPRNIYQHGLSSIRYFLTSFLVTSFLLGFTILALLDRVVLSRLAGLNQRVSSIHTSHDLSVPLPVAGNDEITSLTRSINTMLVELQQSQKEVLQSEEELRTILKTARDGYFLADKNGHFLDVNDAFCRMLGFLYEEILALSFHDISPSYETSAEMTRHFNAILQTKSALFEIPLCHKNGQLIDAEISVNYLEIDGGRFFTFIRNVTERKRAQEELRSAKLAAEAANLTKSAFMANVSHELRTPLTIILGYTDMIQIDKYLSSEHHYAIHAIQQSGLQLLTMINDILELTRIEANQIEIIRAEIHLESMITQICEMMEIQAERKGLQLKRVLPHDLSSMVFGDETRIRQVLFHLIGNAIKFTSEGFVEISMQRTNDTYCFKIKDSGIGISEANIPELFRPFQQIGDVMTAKPEGTGLGLAISQRLVQAMNSEIKVQSKPGEGSVFWFELELPSALEGDPGF